LNAGDQRAAQRTDRTCVVGYLGWTSGPHDYSRSAVLVNAVAVFSTAPRCLRLPGSMLGASTIWR